MQPFTYSVAWTCQKGPFTERLQETMSLQFLHVCEHHLKVFLTDQHLRRMEGLAVTNTKNLKR